MKKLATIAILALSFAVQANAQTLCTFSNFVDSTCTSVFKKEGRFYIETRLMKTDESFGIICIGRTLDEVMSVMKDTEFFLSRSELEYMLIRIGEEFPKLIREPDGMYGGINMTPFLTDGTETYIPITVQIIDNVMKALSSISSVK